MNTQRQKMKMQQKLTPQQLLLLRLLQLPVTQLEQKIKEEVEKNPMIEVDSAPVQEVSEAPEADDYDDNDEENDFKGIDIDDYFDDDDYSYRERLESDRNSERRQYDFADGTSFTESLIRQMELLGFNERERSIANEIIGSIDGTGYLGRDTQLIANDMAFRSDMEVSNEEVVKVLKAIQTLDPAGIGARNLQECLLIQLHRIPEPDKDTQLAIKIIERYFGQLTNKNYASLMTVLKIDEKQLNRVLSVIRRLNPKPGWGREEENKGAHYIIPDFIVTAEDGRLNFTLSSRNSPQLRINSEYTEMLQQLSTHNNLNKSERETVNFIKEKTDSAQALIDTIDQRKQTMATTMDAILKYQQQYFITGDTQDLKPMRLKDIAEMTGFDESTISRVVNEKYVQTDFGTFLLKDIFSKAVVTQKGETLAIEHIKEALKKIIDEEDKSNPMTDEAIVKILQDKGFQMSRRTVAKYRESMDIPVGRLRREIKEDAE
ncbi:MAG: RNA polymerase factor sigma-54 [Bacteroidales bacterium]|nr:RNA polymerase factor sigma-54 [Bacteroidales bacterium]